MGILLVSPKDSTVDFLGIYNLSPQDVCVVGVGTQYSSGSRGVSMEQLSSCWWQEK